MFKCLGLLSVLIYVFSCTAYYVDLPEIVQYKLCVVMYSCLHGQSPWYLTDFYV